MKTSPDVQVGNYLGNETKSNVESKELETSRVWLTTVHGFVSNCSPKCSPSWLHHNYHNVSLS